MRPVLVLTEQLLDVIKNSGATMVVAVAALSAAQRLVTVEPDPAPRASEPVTRSSRKTPA